MMDKIFHEFSGPIEAGSRYAAHCEIENKFASRSRRSRTWRYCLLDTEVDGFWAVVRTDDASLVSEFASAGRWVERSLASAGQDVDLWVQIAPKRASQRVALRNAEDSFRAWFEGYLCQRDLLTNPSVELLRRQVVRVDKGPSGGVDNFTSPTAHLRIRGRVADADKFNEAYLAGLGDLRAFGVGLPIMHSSALFEMSLAVSEL